MHSVGLRLNEASIEARLDSEQRRGFRKPTDPTLYRKLRDAGAFTLPSIPRTDLVIDGEELSATLAASRIARHFLLA